MYVLGVKKINWDIVMPDIEKQKKDTIKEIEDKISVYHF